MNLNGIFLSFLCSISVHSYISTILYLVVDLDSHIPKHMSQLFRIATSAEKDVNKTSFSIETTSIHCKWQEAAAEISNSKTYVCTANQQ